MIRLKREDCALLHLPLKRKWFDMIASGEKGEEYRDHTPYWSVRIQNAILKDKQIIAAFSLGRTRATMFFDVSLIKAVSGSQHPEWGEPKDLHYLILLGERVEMVEDNGAAARRADSGDTAKMREALEKAADTIQGFICGQVSREKNRDTLAIIRSALGTASEGGKQ